MNSTQTFNVSENECKQPLQKLKNFKHDLNLHTKKVFSVNESYLETGTSDNDVECN